MVGWHHQLIGHGFGWNPDVSDGQRGRVCCGSWDRKESDTTERLNNNPYDEKNFFVVVVNSGRSCSSLALVVGA